jgi:hypothetical protein
MRPDSLKCSAAGTSCAPNNVNGPDVEYGTEDDDHYDDDGINLEDTDADAKDD